MEATLDIRGLLCPLTWARVRVQLGRLAPGDLLVVTLDHRPAVPDIVRNAEELGHEVAGWNEISPGIFEMRIRRG